MILPNLDLDILRTLIAAVNLGSLRKAADYIGRSQSAVSQQLRKLENQIEQPLFRRNGRGLALTEAGELTISYAKRLVELNDEAVRAVRGTSVEGAVRFGLPGDFSETWLPLALGEFKRMHKGVRVEIAVDKNRALLERLDRGELDMVLAMANEDRSDAQPVTAIQMSWIGPANGMSPLRPDVPIELALYNAPCFFRKACISALDAENRPWHLSYTTSSLQSLWAGVTAGLGITVRIGSGLPGTLRCLGSKEGLPALPAIKLCLHTANRQLSPAGDALRQVVIDTIEKNLSGRGLLPLAIEDAADLR